MTTQGLGRFPFAYFAVIRVVSKISILWTTVQPMVKIGAPAMRATNLNQVQAAHLIVPVGNVSDRAITIANASQARAKVVAVIHP